MATERTRTGKMGRPAIVLSSRLSFGPWQAPRHGLNLGYAAIVDSQCPARGSS